MFVKDLLIESLARAGHVKRNFPAPAEEITKAEGFLKSALRKYSGDSLITAFQKVFTFTPSDAEVTIGKPTYRRGVIVHHCKRERDIPVATTMTVDKDYCLCDFVTGTDPETSVPLNGKKLTLVNNVKTWTACSIAEFCDNFCDEYCYDMGSQIVSAMVYDNSCNEWAKLDFNALADFYSNNSLGRYNAAGIGENKVIVRIPEGLVGRQLRLIYNASMKFGINEYIELPEDQIEMLTLAVTVSLLSEDGDSDGQQLANFKMQLQDVVESIASRNVTTRRIQRGERSWASNRLAKFAGSVANW